jgi:RNA-binding protein
MPQDLTEKQRKYLRGLAHAREPVVLVGAGGASTALATELDAALSAHELVKIRVRVGDRELRGAILEELRTHTHSTLVQRIGNVGVLYRKHKERPRIILPDD